MLIKTVVDSIDAKTYKSYCKANGQEKSVEIELNITEVEYDDAFAKDLSCEISGYLMHTKYTHDYESSSDSGDGRDDYYTEEEDVEISLTECIIKNNKLYGVMCECFGMQRFLLLDYPETVIYHPQNYEGRNYHYYRQKQFKLIEK